MNLPLDSDINTLELTPASRNFLLETAKWSKFLSIVGFVFLVILIIAAFGIGFFFNSMSSEFDEFGGAGGMIGGTAITVLYLFMALIYFFPTYYLFQFSVKTTRAINASNTIELTDGLENLKSCFKYWGILMVIILGFYALGFGFMLIGGLGAAF